MALKQQWAPVLADMEARTGLTVKPFFASDYAGIIEGMRFNKVQVAYFGNKSAMEAVDRADGEIFAQAIQANGQPGYYSLLITHKDTDIHSLDDVLKIRASIISPMAIRIPPRAFWCPAIMSSPRTISTPRPISSAW